MDGQAKAADPLKHWRELVDISDIKNETYRTQVLDMLEHQERMCFGHLGEIKGVAFRIELNPGSSPLYQQSYSSIPERHELIEEHSNKMFAADVI